MIERTTKSSGLVYGVACFGIGCLQCHHSFDDRSKLLRPGNFWE